MSGYIGTQPVPQATQTRQTFVATAAQTSFATGGYSVGYLDTFLNGVKLQDGVDYTATNGSDIVLTTGAALDDILEVVAYTAFEVLNQTFTGITTVAELKLESATPRITFTDTDGTDKWTSIFEGNGNTYYISRNGANRGQHIWEQVDGGVYTHAMRLNGSGALLHGTTTAGSAGAGDIVVNGGVYLGGTAAANKLDDYEEGTFTPSFTFGGAAVGITYNNQRGTYTKVGNLVTFQIGIFLSSNGTSTGSLNIIGLPFTVKDEGFGSYTAAPTFNQVTGFSGAPICQLLPNSTLMRVRMPTATGFVTHVTDAEAGNTCYVQVSGSYLAA
tara:strand:- start:244 stop:1230 length:987 start_codon:yes stop_codon:yes gene_type:complete